MNNIISVDRNKCLKDGLCVAECPLTLLEQDKDGYPVPVKNADKGCIDCGHCVAVCPSGALDQRRMASVACVLLQEELAIKAEQVEQYMCARRSIRQYLQKPVEEKKIQRLLKVAGYAPSGHNSQPTKWIVITDSNEVHRLAGLVAEWIRWVIEHQPEFAAMMHMDKIVAAWNDGQDRILRNAPHLLIAYAPKNDRTAQAAIVSAITYLELFAPGLGLGTCWAGFFYVACQTFEPLRKAIALSEGHAVHGALMLGYPKPGYYRIPVRKDVDVIWR